MVQSRIVWRATDPEVIRERIAEAKLWLEIDQAQELGRDLSKLFHERKA